MNSNEITKQAGPRKRFATAGLAMAIALSLSACGQAVPQERVTGSAGPAVESTSPFGPNEGPGGHDLTIMAESISPFGPNGGPGGHGL